VKEAKDGRIDKLKKRIKRLENENKRLKSELNSFEQAFKNTRKFLIDNTDEITLEGLIDAAKKGSSLKQAQEDGEDKVCGQCLSTEYKELPTRFGFLKICNKCGHTETEKK